MSEPTEIITIHDLEAMTAAERTTVIREAVVTDLDSLDEHTAAVVARGAARVRARLQSQD